MSSIRSVLMGVGKILGSPIGKTKTIFYIYTAWMRLCVCLFIKRPITLGCLTGGEHLRETIATINSSKTECDALLIFVIWMI